MSKNKTDNQYNEPELLEFIDEDGIVEKFEYLDTVNYNGADYAVLLPYAENGDCPQSVYIFEIVEELDSETDTYVGIDDQNLVDCVYDIFMKNHKDDFNFYD